MQGRYLPNSKWAPCDPDEEALAEDAQRRQVNNVAGAACVTRVGESMTALNGIVRCVASW